MTRALLFGSALLCCSTACSAVNDHAPSPPACTGLNCAATTGPGGIGGGKNDAAIDAADETAIGDAGVAVTAVVRALARFTDDPAMGTPVTMNVVVRANKVGTGTVDSTVAADGTHSLTGVLVTPSTPTNLALLQSGVLRANDGVWLPVSGTLTLPLFPDTLAGATWPTVVAGAMAMPIDSGHAVIHVVDKTGARIKGATAPSFTSADAKGPFYDDGSDISSSATSTGTRGTILFLGSRLTEIAVTVASGGKTLALRLPLSANAVTYVTAPMN